MAILRKRTAVIPVQTMTVGEFDPMLPGGYDNVKTFPLPVRKGRSLSVKVEADHPVDVAVSGPDGRVIRFEEGMTSGTLGPIVFEEKCTAALMIGVFRGDKSRLELEAWTE